MADRSRGKAPSRPKPSTKTVGGGGPISQRPPHRRARPQPGSPVSFHVFAESRCHTGTSDPKEVQLTKPYITAAAEPETHRAEAFIHSGMISLLPLLSAMTRRGRALTSPEITRL